MRLSKIGSIFSTLVRISLRKRASPGTVHLQAGFINVLATGFEGGEMEDKVIKEMQSLLIQLKIIRDNVNRWDTLWASYEGCYKEMSGAEVRAFNAELHVIANNTMNELSSIMKYLLKKSVPFEERSTSNRIRC